MLSSPTTTTSSGRTAVVDDDERVPAVRTVDRSEPTTSRVITATQPWAHVSGLATLCLMMGTAAAGATLTGLLAPLGFAAGAIAIVLGIAGMGSVRHSGVTGHSLIGLGVLLGAASMLLAYLAITNQLPWLHSDTNEVANLHNWLDAHISWLAQW